MLVLSGCRSVMPPPGATESVRLGPFVEYASGEDGASLLAVRPFFSYAQTETNAPTFRSEYDLLWPLAVNSRRDDHRYWRALLFYGTDTDEDMTSPNDPYRFRLFPFLFAGRALDGDDYAAVFPLGGRIRNFMLFNDVSFFLFPLYANTQTAGVETETYLWPFYLTRKGDGLEQLRLWPFYGTRTKTDDHMTRKSRFLMWPIWSEDELSGQVSGSGYLLFPFYGYSCYERQRRGTIVNRTILPPFFQFGYGDDGYRKVYAPWPFYRAYDSDDDHERHYWPFYGKVDREDFERRYYAWPLFFSTELESDGYRNRTLHAPTLLYFHRESESMTVDEAGDEVVSSRSSYSRLWPLFSYRDTPQGGVTVRFPELSLWSNSVQVERNWAPLWSLYTYRKRPSGAYCNELLWGLLSWGRNEDGGAIFSFLWIPFAD